MFLHFYFSSKSTLRWIIKCLQSRGPRGGVWMASFGNIAFLRRVPLILSRRKRKIWSAIQPSLQKSPRNSAIQTNFITTFGFSFDLFHMQFRLRFCFIRFTFVLWCCKKDLIPLEDHWLVKKLWNTCSFDVYCVFGIRSWVNIG